MTVTDIAVIIFKPFHFRNGFVMAVLLLKPPCSGFRIETATWIQGSRYNSFSRRKRRAWHTPGVQLELGGLAFYSAARSRI
jgi:hypothetical protein